jgi:hypothetical protein
VIRGVFKLYVIFDKKSASSKIKFEERYDELFQNGFPRNMSDDVCKVVGLIPLKTYNNVSVTPSEHSIQYYIGGNLISFPYRIYNIDTTEEVINKLSLQQQMILHCIYSRSCNGFVRQKHIKALLQIDYENWSIPYIIKLSDEYVVEVLEVLYDNLKNEDTQQIKEFCLENAQSFCKSYARMISYWNEFYRDRCSDFHKYIGRKLFRECFGYSRTLEKMK